MQALQAFASCAGPAATERMACRRGRQRPLAARSGLMLRLVVCAALAPGAAAQLVPEGLQPRRPPFTTRRRGLASVLACWSSS